LLVEKALSFKTDLFLCVSEAMEKDMHKMGIPKRKTVMIHNGVDLEMFYPRRDRPFYKKRLNIQPEVNLIGTVGRMVPEKGQVYLIHALKYLRNLGLNIRCLFVGEGPLQNQLKRTAVEMGVDHLCEFIGRRLDIELIYPALDIFILPSPREPFGLVLLEAMATGVPVIATNSGGPSTFIETDVNGVLVPPEDAKELAGKIVDLLMRKKDRKSMGETGRETVLAQFDIHKTVSQIEDVYCSLSGREIIDIS
jgi:glycosyltransferase involved in cell wall biosynthesis